MTWLIQELRYSPQNGIVWLGWQLNPPLRSLSGTSLHLSTCTDVICLCQVQPESSAAAMEKSGGFAVENDGLTR